MTSSRKDKRWLKSVTDPDLVSFFEDSQFDAGEYAKGFFEQREASHAAKRWAKKQRQSVYTVRYCCSGVSVVAIAFSANPLQRLSCQCWAVVAAEFMAGQDAGSVL